MRAAGRDGSVGEAADGARGFFSDKAGRLTTGAQNSFAAARSHSGLSRGKGPRASVRRKDMTRGRPVTWCLQGGSFFRLQL